MPSLDTTTIAVPTRTHRRLLTETTPGHYEMCIDNTTLEKMLTCPRAFEFYAVYGRDTLKKDALNYGSALHHALEVFYNADDPFDPATFDAMCDRIMQHFAAFPSSGDDWRHADHAIEAARRYVRWRKQCPVWTPVVHEGRKMVEVPFKLELMRYNDPDSLNEFVQYPSDLVVAESNMIHGAKTHCLSVTVYWTGKIDLVIRRDDDTLWPVDHKTTSIEGPTLYSSFQLASQFMGYAWATQKLLDEPVSGVIADVLVGRPPTRTGVGYENKAFPIDFSQDQLTEWLRDTREHISVLLDRLFRGYFPKQTAWCVSKFGLCPYHDVCTMPAAAQPHILMSGQYAEMKWNPLIV